LRSDAEDLLHYTAAYLGAGKAGDVPVPAELTKAMAFAREPTEVQITEAPANRQGYAWVVVHAGNEANVVVLKDGGTAGFSSCVAMMPARASGVVVLVNSTRTLACKKARAVLHAMAVAADKSNPKG
jgi:CubicO group peptidase (beta-lactamase class C family)